MIKKTLLLLFFAVLSLSSEGSFVVYAQAPLSVGSPKLMDVVSGVLYLQLKAHHGIDFENLSATHTGSAELDNLFASIGVTEIEPFDPEAKNYASSRHHGIDRMYVIYFSEEGRSPRLIGHDFLNLDVVEGASPRFIFEKCSYTPNDSRVSDQYALDKMKVKDAWAVSKGNANIVIADLDQGVNYNHEDLKGNISLVEGHIGKDIVGDSGWQDSIKKKFYPDFDPMPGPGQSHGTFTTGCFGMTADNSKGGAGTGFNCKIMAVKIANNAGELIGGYEGIIYAATHGAKIINCSWGGYVDMRTEAPYAAYLQNIINTAIDNGVLIVAASGNDHLDIDVDSIHFVPASLKKILTVGASTETDVSASFSNYGKTVSVYAPGANIFSTDFPGDQAYNFSGGTSFSCPLAAGVAGLVLAKNPTWTPQFVIRQMIETADNVVNPGNRVKYWGRVNAYSALTKVTVPGIKITGFSVDGVDSGGLAYSDKVYSLVVKFKDWMAPGIGIQAKLLPIDGYTVQQGTFALGTMNSLQEVPASFKFTRDGTDDGAGSQLTLYFAISYGTATVEGQKYYDTLRLYIDITGDDAYVVKGVADGNTNILHLGNTYPNPVSTEAAITFDLIKQGHITLSISDVLGRTIRILSEGMFDAGNHRIHFDAHTLDNGVYTYKLETSDGAVMTKRMIVIH